jgi:DNA-binding LacI/PurR family transcriptional regulator
MKRTTIKDIAREVGVTHVTVSKVINNKGRISEKTKKKVFEAIEKLEYYPNYAARSLVKGRTNNIAVIEPGFTGFPMSIITGAQDANVKSNYDLNLYSSRATGEGAINIFRKLLNEKRADAVIVVSIGMDDSFLFEYKKAGIPVILIETESKGASSVLADNENGAFKATEYLISKGRKKIGIVADLRSATRPQLERYSGYTKALMAAGIAPREDLIFPTLFYRYEDGREAFKVLRDKGADSIFCIAGDRVAFGAAEEARKAGLKMPVDFSIIGFDDDTMAENLGLTTVKQPIYEMGKKAFELAVLAAENKAGESETIVFATDLIVRGTA